MRETYESDPAAFPAEAYHIPTSKAWRGVSLRVRGWEMEACAVWACPDCPRTGVERPHGGGYIVLLGDPNCDHEHASYNEDPEFERTGRVVVVMIGDDKQHLVDPEDLVALDEDAYCHECGQIGCCHDGRDRNAD